MESKCSVITVNSANRLVQVPEVRSLLNIFANRYNQFFRLEHYSSGAYGGGIK